LIAFSAVAQTIPEIAKSAVKIEMLFPEGKTKALILSHDHGSYPHSHQCSVKSNMLFDADNIRNYV